MSGFSTLLDGIRFVTRECVRIKITRTRQGEIDGVDLSMFQVGIVYEVAPSLATYLITTSSAELAPAEIPDALMPMVDARVSVMSEQLRAAVANERLRSPRGDAERDPKRSDEG